MATNPAVSAVARATVLTTVANALGLANAVIPDVVAIIALFRDSAATLESLLADADTTEQAEIAKLKAELGIS